MLNTIGSESVTPLSSSSAEHQYLIGLGPIQLPEYLNRPQWIVETANNQYELDENHRWAERLDQNISRVLVKQLTDSLAVEQVLMFPWSSKLHVDYQIALDILEFHQGVDGHSHLKAQWRVMKDSQMLYSKNFTCSLAADQNPASIVKAQSECLHNLGIDMAVGLHAIAGK